MPLQQAINRLDHLAILIRQENIEKYKKLFSDVLGITWEEPVANESAGVVAIASWDSGLELIAPLRESGRIWDRIQKFGEGTVTIIFGVPDIEAAKARAVDAGAKFLFDIEMVGDEPWLHKFKLFREAKIDMFPEDFSSTVTLSQIEPA
jgi:predicted enzyme related to lactoylglutathione lyase